LSVYLYYRLLVLVSVCIWGLECVCVWGGGCTFGCTCTTSKHTVVTVWSLPSITLSPPSLSPPFLPPSPHSLPLSPLPPSPPSLPPSLPSLPTSLQTYPSPSQPLCSRPSQAEQLTYFCNQECASASPETHPLPTCHWEVCDISVHCLPPSKDLHTCVS